jgi:two-component system response regulator NreC
MEKLRSLTSREWQVLQLVLDGASNKVIARTLGLTLKTVEYHRKLIMFKLGLKGTALLVRFAIKHRIIIP